MNIINNELIKKQRDELYKQFTFYSRELLEIYEKNRLKVCTWEYSLGATRDIIPFEHLIPSVRKGKGRVLKKLTKSSSESKNLVTYGLNDNSDVILSKSRYNKDIEKHGENFRIIDDDFILNAHLYSSYPERNTLLSICHTYKKDEFVYYVSITPPYDWFVRIDKIDSGRVIRSSMFATSWFKQMDCDFIYDNNDHLSMIMMGDIIHWKNYQ